MLIEFSEKNSQTEAFEKDCDTNKELRLEYSRLLEVKEALELSQKDKMGKIFVLERKIVELQSNAEVVEERHLKEIEEMRNDLSETNLKLSAAEKQINVKCDENVIQTSSNEKVLLHCYSTVLH